jgi:hypothetical protein
MHPTPTSSAQSDKCQSGPDGVRGQVWRPATKMGLSSDPADGREFGSWRGKASEGR